MPRVYDSPDGAIVS